ncbi:MAG: aminodeoxychorismate/anthranilate synthase component II [Alphaproteobacteria bacterium GM202ARS2]|nr:aminodeoxychorismate/anthranilate synthase component II [Alphaproteobacteria bacterium GM202ARS2]
MFLLIDNYDSFTWNLVHYFGELGIEVKVVRNDALTVDEALSCGAKAIVISPGPCDPERSGICLELLRRNAESQQVVPMLGICLGHQALGQSFGGNVIRAPAPMHGKVSSICHQGQGILAGLNQPFSATRYHSLIVEEESLPSVLEITARSADDKLIMALHHKTLPLYGVQFHPESIATEQGHHLLKNFIQVVS